MNALSVARAVNSTTLTRPSTAATPITPTAVILNPPFFDPAAPIMSASARLTLSNTPIAFRARYSTEVATIAMKNSTNDTAKLNFITDHGSMRLRNSRARRGPRAAAAETAVRALSTASATRPAPRGTVRPRVPVAPTAPVEMGAVGDSTGVTRPAVSRAPAGTAARPVLTLAGGADDGAAGGGVVWGLGTVGVGWGGRGPRSGRRLCLRHELVLFVRLVGIASNGHQGDSVGKVHELYAHCVPVARASYRLHRGPDHAPVRRDREQLVVRADHDRTHQSTTALGDSRGEYALSTPALHRVLVDRGSFGVSAVRGDQHVESVAHDLHRQQLVTAGEAHADHARRRPTHRAQDLVGGTEPDRLGVLGDQQQIVLRADQRGSDQLVVVTYVD